MTGAKYVARPWSCRDFDEDDCRQQVQESLKEHYNTAYDCLFLSAAATGGREGLLLAAYHSGDIRIFNWQRLCSTWLSSRAQQGHELSLAAHVGPVYALTLLDSPEHGLLLATAGDDGFVRIWRVADILAAAAAAAGPAADSGSGAAAGQAAAAAVRPAAAVQVPHVQNCLGISDGSQPAAQALAADQQQQQLFVGASDGGVHLLDVPRLLAAAAGQAAAAAASCLVPLTSHVAAVLALDYCAATQQLASGSEDGTVRLYDVPSRRCASIIHLQEELLLQEADLAELLRCAKSPPVTCVKFDQGGHWLVAGSGAAGLGGEQQGSLTLWNCSLNSAAKHRSIGKCMPQVLVLTPSTVYVAGTSKQVHTYSFQLEEARSLDVGAESVFGIAVDAESGMLAVCGAKACIDLLSAQGATLGVVRPAASVLMS
ncbi:hypothetical protein OEZ86_008522 [Tetradesmus obliquus]|nr:hypothetical protein OEZ86_008522 [Tetradesmus obliquus]